MNLLDQIDARLSDPAISLNRDEFERAATSMLTDIYPNLVPITGGSDDGRDAEIDDPGGRIAVLVTSARELEGVLANLRSGCRQMIAKSVPIKRLILVNISELNASKRGKIVEAAEAEGFSVVQIYPRPWFADALRRNPEWRLRLLQIQGGPYTLARPPIDDLGIDVDATVGRSDELAAIKSATVDLVVSGVPGVGKTHLVAQIDGALFVEATSDLTALADHLLETQPQVVVLDDAGARPQVLTELRTLRRAHHLGFRVVATCWSHEIEMISDLLDPGASVTIDRMTRPELGEILRAQGITRDAVLYRILEQAHGRPAWAVRLGRLLQEGSAWEDVMRGHSVRGEVGRYLRNARISDHAYAVLASIAVLGGVNDLELRRLADLLGTTVLDLNDTIRKVAQSGLLDAQDGRNDAGERTVTYTVQPDLLAASISADAYFSEQLAPLPLAELRGAFPSHNPSLTLNSITAELVGSSHPCRPSNAQVSDALASASGETSDELVRYYAMLGPAEAAFALGYLLEALGAALAARANEDPDGYLYRYDTTVEKEATLLAELAARSHRQIGIGKALEFLARGARLLQAAGETIEPYLKSYFASARQADLGESVSVADLTALAGEVASLPTGSTEQNDLFVAAAALAIAPSWEVNYVAPDKPRSFNLKSFLMPAQAMGTVAKPILDRLEQDPSVIVDDGFRRLADALESWVRISKGYSLSHGLTPTAEHQAAAGALAKRLAEALARVELSPSLRLRLNEVVAPINLHWPEPDLLFAALTATFDDVDDDDPEGPDSDTESDPGSRYVARWRAKEAAQREAVANVVTPFLDEDPGVFCARIAGLQPALSGARYGGRATLAFAHVAENASDMALWLEAALEHNVGRYCEGLIRRALTDDVLTKDFVERLLREDDTRQMTIRTCLEHGTGTTLATVVAAITPEDFKHRMPDAFVRVTPEALGYLNRHPDRQVAALAMTSWALWYDYRNRRDSSEVEWIDAQIAAIPDWTETMLHLEVPNNLEDHTIERGLVSLAQASPSNFIQLFVVHVSKHDYGIDDFAVWAPAAKVLTHDEKTAAWVQVNGQRHKRNAFWALAGADVDWISKILNGETVEDATDLLITPTLGGPERPTNEDFVALFAPRAEPGPILAALPDTMSGGSVERAEHRLSQARELAESANPAVSAVGKFGVEVYSVRLVEAQKDARARELRGDIWG